jgi:hypothetical protein
MLMSIISISNDTQTISWGDVATWVTGIATILLFVIGFMQIQTERKARIRREKELENQGRREQAELISAWIASEDYGHQWVAILNQSMQPISVNHRLR